MALILTVDLQRPDDRPLRQVAEIVRRGGVIAYPTETVYGIGSGAFRLDPLQRIHTLKRRSVPKPFLILIRNIDELPPLAREVNSHARRLMEVFWPGPLTLLFPAAPDLPIELTRGGGTIGIRFPSSPLCLRLIELSGTPLTSTSANLSGEAPLNTISEIVSVFPRGIDCFLDGGTLPLSAPSTVVDVSGPTPAIVREGAIPTAALVKILPALAR